MPEARKAEQPKLIDLLGTLAAYCRKISSTEYDQRPVAPLQLGGRSGVEELRKIAHTPKESLGIDHIVLGPQDSESLLWSNYLRTQVSEAEIAPPEVFTVYEGSQPQAPELARPVNHLSNAVYYLELSLIAGNRQSIRPYESKPASHPPRTLTPTLKLCGAGWWWTYRRS